MPTWCSTCATCRTRTSFPSCAPRPGSTPTCRHSCSKPGGRELLTDLASMLSKLLPRYEREGKSYLTIAIGCTGGRHRSGRAGRGPGRPRCGRSAMSASSIATWRRRLSRTTRGRPSRANVSGQPDRSCLGPDHQTCSARRQTCSVDCAALLRGDSYLVFERSRVGSASGRGARRSTGVSTSRGVLNRLW